VSDRFRNTQVLVAVPCDPGVSLLTMYSPALRRRADVTLFVPPGSQDRALSLLILMHGVYGSHWNWWVLGKLPATVAEMLASGEIGAFAVAMPSDGLWGDGSGYVAHKEMDAESWIMDDVPACVHELLPNIQVERMFLGGLSMGGFGALRLGAKHASRVAGISAHSPVTSVANLSQHVHEPRNAYLRAGKRDTDPLYWMRRNRVPLPPIRIDCGTEDSLIESNRALHAALVKERVAHEYEEASGGHDWVYWQKQLPRTLRFVSRLAQQG
jgi:putative tributyrin esterase